MHDWLTLSGFVGPLFLDLARACPPAQPWASSISMVQVSHIPIPACRPRHFGGEPDVGLNLLAAAPEHFRVTQAATAPQESALCLSGRFCDFLISCQNQHKLHND